MNAEQVYERQVARMEAKHTIWIRQAAEAGIRKATADPENRDYRRDCAVDEAEKYMFDCFDFQTIKATDISDIACEIAGEVEFDDWMTR
jgi:hypothetical protein